MCIGTITIGTIAKGVLAKAGKFLGSFTLTFWLGLVLAITACIPLAYCKGRSDGRAQVEAEYAKAVKDKIEEARELDAKASDQRATDTERNNDADEARQEAARTGGRTGANCERLRRAHPGRSIPACD